MSLNNTGTLNLSGSRGGKATLDLAGGAAPSVLASTITLAGNSLLEFANGEINSIAAGGKLVVNGTSFVADASDTTHNSALTALTTVAGEFDLGNGVSVALGGALAVTGTLNVDGFYNTFGSTLTVPLLFSAPAMVTVLAPALLPPPMLTVPLFDRSPPTVNVLPKVL